MKITYIFNSGFLLEFKDFDILIDFYIDTEDGLITKEIIRREKPLYVFVSHSHGDHFNEAVLDFKNKRPFVKYIFSWDIKDEIDFDAVYLEKGDEFGDENIHVRAFGSTDEGISFYIEAEDKKIFHAGDLNNWHWEEECDKEESQGYERAFEEELSYICERIQELDILFFPVDPRLGADYMRGAVQILEKITAKLFIPMHFRENYEKANAFEAIAEKNKSKFFRIQKKGDFIIWK
jgi:L-ascorbate metabolism protein UlaG (beta-lactamase superfamily)